jgi:IS5 family transposase
LGLSDEATEDALYDSHAVRHFVGMDLGRESAPDATTLLKFRRMLETHQLTKTIFETINPHLAAEGLMMKGGTVVDATIIGAPPSTKNRQREPDPEMHQTKKGNAWHFGMKAYIGVDLESSLTHTVLATPANTADVTVAHELLHGGETIALGDSGYQGVGKRAPKTDSKLSWHVAMRPGKRRALPDTALGWVRARFERLKASVRARVEHPFHIVKNLLNHKKVRYRGLSKNHAQLYTLFALANLMIAGRSLVPAHARNRS